MAYCRLLSDSKIIVISDDKTWIMSAGVLSRRFFLFAVCVSSRDVWVLSVATVTFSSVYDDANAIG